MATQKKCHWAVAYVRPSQDISWTGYLPEETVSLAPTKKVAVEIAVVYLLKVLGSLGKAGYFSSHDIAVYQKKIKNAASDWESLEKWMMQNSKLGRATVMKVSAEYQEAPDTRVLLDDGKVKITFHSTTLKADVNSHLVRWDGKKLTADRRAKLHQSSWFTIGDDVSKIYLAEIEVGTKDMVHVTMEEVVGEVIRRVPTFFKVITEKSEGHWYLGIREGLETVWEIAK